MCHTFSHKKNLFLDARLIENYIITQYMSIYHEFKSQTYHVSKSVPHANNVLRSLKHNNKY